MKTYIFNRRRVQVACLSAVTAVVLLLGGCTNSSTSDIPNVIEANIDTLVAQIGGATQDVKLYNDGTTDWTLYTMANRFAATPVGMSKGTVTEITVPGYIQHITVASYNGQSYALLSMGGKGIGVVNITNPAAMSYVRTMSVNYDTPEYTYSDGGGTVFTEPASTVPHTSGPVNDLLVYNDGSIDQLLIANGAFGIQKTALANLMGAAADGVLPIDSGQWTLKYSGENSIGGPLSLKRHGGKLYVALGFLGIGIYDPADLTVPRLGAYNLYADCANTAQEDWFGYPKRKIACPDASLNAAANVVAGGVDADGMATYLQAANELGNKSGLTWYPWAEFNRYGKYYYNARSMDVVDLPGPKTVAYIAYSLGGLVAVNVTNPAAPLYEGYVPAAPAHGPDEAPINVDKKGILSHFGSGMLKEAGVMGVRVVPDSDAGPGKLRAYYTDHFAGLVVVSGAEDMGTNWKNGVGNFTSVNDTDTRVFWPDYEFVKSYDMHPVTVGDESMPAFLVGDSVGNYTAPVQLVTGEINGHGGSLFLMPCMETASCAAGSVGLVEASGAGGVSFVSITTLTGTVGAVTDRFAVPVNLASTNEVGALESGAPGQSIAIGHGEGVTVSGNYLYLADGPHGVSVWRIADGLSAIDDLHLVANTLQSEYPTGTVMPTPHAFKVAFGSDPNQAYVMSQSLGMRRLNVSAVAGAAVGAPALLDAAGNIFEHNTEAGNVGAVKILGQDHAYGVTFYGKYAIVADGGNGLTVYDTTAVGGTAASVVDNIGGTLTGKAPVGRAASVKLWSNPATGRIYAVVAAGAYGVSVVDMTERLVNGQLLDQTRDLVKTFEPLKADADNPWGSADGKSVDVHVVGDMAYFSYDSFGLVAYRMADLIQPVAQYEPAVKPDGQAAGICATAAVTKLSAKQGGVGECRPTAAGYFKLQKQAGYEALDGGALYMTPQYFPSTMWGAARLLFYVGYGDAGVVKLDWSVPANPRLMAIKGVIGGAGATAINNGRVYVAAGTGGLTVLK